MDLSDPIAYIALGIALVGAVLLAGVGVALLREHLMPKPKPQDGAGSPEQVREFAAWREERAEEQVHVDPTRVLFIIDPDEQTRRAKWRGQIDAEIADINDRFTELVKTFDDSPIVWNTPSNLSDAAMQAIYRLDPTVTLEIALWAPIDHDPSWKIHPKDERKARQRLRELDHLASTTSRKAVSAPH